MKLGFTISRVGLAAAAMMLAAAMILFTRPASLSEDQCLYLEDGSVSAVVDPGVLTYEGPLLSGVQVYCDERPDTKLHVLADVSVDGSFVQQTNHLWKKQVRQMVRETNLILTPLRIEIDIVSLQTWNSDGSTGHISQRLSAAEDQTDRQPGNLLIAITGDASSRFDGLARQAGGALIVRHYDKHLERGPMLIAHEFGHLLGANHHGEDDECGEEECIMGYTGYIRSNNWCHHHLEVIEENIKTRLGHSIS